MAAAELLDPVELFFEFLTRISHDHRVVLDLILSPETRFLTHFLALLHHINNKRQSLIMSAAVLDEDMRCEEESGPETLSGVLKITSGLEALISYEMDSDESQTDSETSSDSGSGEEDDITSSKADSLTAIFTFFDDLHVDLRQMQQQKLIPFNVSPLLTLMEKLNDRS